MKMFEETPRLIFTKSRSFVLCACDSWILAGQYKDRRISPALGFWKVSAQAHSCWCWRWKEASMVNASSLVWLISYNCPSDLRQKIRVGLRAQELLRCWFPVPSRPPYPYPFKLEWFAFSFLHRQLQPKYLDSS